MATAPVPVAGTDFDWGGTTIDEVTSFNGMSLENAAVDVSNIATTWKAFISSQLVGLKPVTMDITWDANNAAIHDILQDDLITTTNRALSITYKDAGTTVYSCTAFVTDFERTGALAGALTGTVTFQPTGALTIT